MKTTLRTALVSFFLALWCTVGLATSLGNSSWMRVDAPELRRHVDLSPEFFHEVGGVASQGRAKCVDCVIQSVAYRANLKDGERLSLTIKLADGTVTTATVKAYDWQLKPSFQVAQSGFGSAVTLFGHLRDKAKEERTIGNIVNYHPALTDTVMGLRLLQADLLIIAPDAADLFKDESGKYILAPGEPTPDVSANQKRWEAVSAVIDNSAEYFHSYVVGDIGQTILFRVEAGKVRFESTPYWHSWRTDTSSPKYEEAKGILSQLHDLDWEEETTATRRQIEALKVKLVATKKQIPVVKLDALSSTISQSVKANGGINPHVYDALNSFLTLTALARELAATNTAEFTEVVRRVSASKDVPKVETPTVRGFIFDLDDAD